ncbi:MAG: transglutaminase domain-containing protein [Gammaproteobacteria bacterium]|nr:transglutaminase domain-containing protein [Gammaproteobacteria bacterium]
MFIAASLVLAAVVWAGTRAADSWSPEALDGRVDWYAVSLRGEQVGYLRVSYRREAEGIAYENRLELRGRAQGAAFHQVHQERLLFDAEPPYRVREGRLRRAQDQLVQEQSFLNGAEGLVFQDGRREQRLAASGYGFDDVAAPMRWSAASQTPELASRYWDWERRGEVGETYRRLPPEGSGTRAEQRQAGSQLISLMDFAPDGTPTRLTVGGNLLMERTSEAQALSFKASTDLYFEGGVPVDKKLGNARLLRRLELRVVGALDWPAAPGQVMRDGVLTVERPAALEDAPKPAQAEALALDPRLGQGDGELDALARRATQGSRSDRERVQALTAFVAEYLRDEPVLQPISASELRRERRGDCTEHAQFFVALARRLGIPAREVSGLVYLGDSHQRFGGHAWAEVALAGRWQAVDPTWNAVGVDASHIRFGEGREGEERLFLLPEGLRFEVVSAESYD